MAQIYWFWIEALLAREGQQTVNQTRLRVRRLQSTPNQWRSGGIIAYPVHCQSRHLPITIVSRLLKLVGHTPGQLTDNLKLLRLAQSRLSGLPFRDFCLKAKVGPAQFKSQSRRIG